MTNQTRNRAMESSGEHSVESPTTPTADLEPEELQVVLGTSPVGDSPKREDEQEDELFNGVAVASTLPPSSGPPVLDCDSQEVDHDGNLCDAGGWSIIPQSETGVPMEIGHSPGSKSDKKAVHDATQGQSAGQLTEGIQNLELEGEGLEEALEGEALEEADPGPGKKRQKVVSPTEREG